MPNSDKTEKFMDNRGACVVPFGNAAKGFCLRDPSG
jgi:hypothetical protein